MKRKTKDRTNLLLLILYSVALVASSAYIAARYVSPCVCVVGVSPNLVN